MKPEVNETRFRGTLRRAMRGLGVLRTGAQRMAAHPRRLLAVRALWVLGLTFVSLPAPLARVDFLAGAADPTPTQDATPFTLGLAAPDSVIDSLFQRVLQAGVGHRAFGAYPLSRLHTHSVAGKENGGRKILALPSAHPVRIHDPSVDLEAAEVGSEHVPPTLGCCRPLHH